ncbi:MAG: LysR substrate-binding domain-containing protein [Pseudomonadota bacterium]
MVAPLDLDQLKTFVAIAEAGSFTKAADVVFKTQSAVSMQMRKLEERIGKTLFVRDGRQSRLSDDGERLLVYARRLVRLSSETLAAFDENRLEGVVRFGMPDDFADRFLPEVLARFAHSNPRVEVEFDCVATPTLVESLKQGRLDLALITHDGRRGNAEVVREEPLCWVTSAHHDVHRQDVLSMAFGRETCIWRRQATERLEAMERAYRVKYSSWSATVIAATVLSGLAVSVLPESALRPGMRVLGEDDGFPPLDNCQIGLIWSANIEQGEIVSALADHIVESLGNLTSPLNAMDTEPIDKLRSIAHRKKRLRPGHMMAGW